VITLDKNFGKEIEVFMKNRQLRHKKLISNLRVRFCSLSIGKADELISSVEFEAELPYFN
jgi:hypothetical protein